ncbi:hypothetical protein H0H81_007151 [Sphagnurus paluster]|uniref:Uncharacterized protein n=1 Tax=Sphagnurus paluster TaxID=117069 RepID=A0A9P7K590_9AGAR|nr:hypothetical protein H0H81_007151 [Sphagnurus paluster]
MPTQHTYTKVSQRLSLRTYLSLAFLPAIKRSDSKSPLNSLIRRARAWPNYQEMHQKPGVRCLREILRTDTVKFVMLVRNYLDAYLANAYLVNEDMVDEADSPNLRLPGKGIVLYDDNDINLLSNIDNEEILLSVVQDYILGTVSDALRIAEGLEPDSPSATVWSFRQYSHLCLAHHARWDILALPGTDAHPLPLLVFFVPPWEFGTEDFTELTDAQRFQPPHALDAPATNAHKLWAVIHDTCLTRGRFFIVSNYTQWAFGELSPDDTQATITTAFEAPILAFNGKYRATPALGCNVIEMLVFWTRWALGPRP